MATRTHGVGVPMRRQLTTTGPSPRFCLGLPHHTSGTTGAGLGPLEGPLHGTSIRVARPVQRSCIADAASSQLTLGLALGGVAASQPSTSSGSCLAQLQKTTSSLYLPVHASPAALGCHSFWCAFGSFLAVPGDKTLGPFDLLGLAQLAGRLVPVHQRWHPQRLPSRP